MTRPCLVCREASVSSIPQGRVCRTHAIEFYVGLVAYAVEQARADLNEPDKRPAAYAPSTPRVLPGPRMTRAYVKNATKWFKPAA